MLLPPHLWQIYHVCWLWKLSYAPCCKHLPTSFEWGFIPFTSVRSLLCMHPSVQKYLQKSNPYLASSLALFPVLLSVNCTAKSPPQIQPQQKRNHLNKINVAGTGTNVLKWDICCMGVKRTGGFEQLRKIMKTTVQFLLQMFYSFEKNFIQFYLMWQRDINLSFEFVEM